MIMPNFFVIGAAKSGTTTLHNYLNQHPEIYMSPLKEPEFFCHDGQCHSPITNLEDYLALFQEVSDEIAIGESSAAYMGLSEVAAKNIQHYIPNAKLIAILREPADALYSNYLMMHGNQLNDGSSVQKICDGFAHMVENKRSGLINHRYYYQKLQPYLSRFGREQIKICLFEDLKTDPNGLLKEIFQFLGVDEKFVVDTSIHHNKGGVPKNKLLYDLTTNLASNQTLLRRLTPKGLHKPLQKAFSGLKNRNLAKSPQLTPEIRKQLIELYCEDILKLQVLISRDLSKWLE